MPVRLIIAAYILTAVLVPSTAPAAVPFLDQGVQVYEFLPDLHNATLFFKKDKDPRRKISFLGSNKKYAAIGRVSVNQPIPWFEAGKKIMTGGLEGTGFLVSPCLFFTAYHVVFGLSEKPNTKDFSVTFSSTRSGIGRPIAWGNFSATEGIKKQANEDWALVQLEGNNCLGLETGWLNNYYFDPENNSLDDERSRFIGRPLQSAGYPLALSNHLIPNQLYMQNDTIIYELKDDLFYADGAYSDGQSGSPLFYEDATGKIFFVGMINAYIGAGKLIKTLKKYDKNFANIFIEGQSLIVDQQNYEEINKDFRRHNLPTPQKIRKN